MNAYFSQKEPEDTSSIWVPYGYIKRKQSGFSYNDLKFLLSFVKPFWLFLFIASLFALLNTLGNLMIPFFFKFLADDVLVTSSYSLNNIIFLLVGIISIATIAGFFKQVYFFKFQQKVVLNIQDSLFKRLLYMPKRFFDENSTGYLMSRVVDDVFQLQSLFSFNIVDIFTKSLQLILAVFLLMYINWKLTIISFTVVPLFIIISRFMIKKTRHTNRVAFEKKALVSQDIQEKLSGTALIKTFAAEDKEAEKIIASLKSSARANERRVWVTSFFSLLSGLTNTIGMGFVLWYGAYLIVQKQLSVGGLLAFSAYLGFLIEPAKFLATINNSLQTSFAALERVLELMQLITECENDKDKLRVSKLEGKVKFEHVSFSYDTKTYAIKDISFETKKGQLVAIVGSSGAGKTTLINLILSIYQPSSGNIYFDDIPLHDISLQSLRECIGVVSQEIILFNDSIKNNISYGSPSASDETIFRVSKLADAQEFICNLPNGYETLVGEKGVKLSVGQKQRISIARALLKDPSILIFDEATSAVDPITENTISKMIQDLRKEKTIFVIAHRPSTISSSDLILVLDRGYLVQTGTHTELLKQEGLYQKLCKNQLFNLDNKKIDYNA